MRCLQILLVVTAATALFPRFAFAQGAPDYPTKAVRIIVASPPGGGADLQARMFGQKLADNLKTQFVVDNRPGGGDTIGTGMAAKSAPDGYIAAEVPRWAKFVKELGMRGQ